MSFTSDNRQCQTQSSNYRWVIIATWVGSHVFGFVVLESLGLMLPSINLDFHLSPIQEGLLGSAPRIGTILFSIPAGWWLSKYSPKKLTTITLAIGIVLVIMQGWAPFFLLLLLGRFLYGITLVAREPARALLIRQWVLPNELVLVNSVSNMLWGVTAIGFLLTPLLLDMLNNNWRSTFYVFAGISLGFNVIWQICGKERTSKEYLEEIQSKDRSPLASILKYRELWIISIGLLGTGITWSAFATFWPTFMLEVFEVSIKTSAMLMAISGIVGAFAGIAVGLLINRIGKRRAILWWTGILLAATQIGLLWTGYYLPLILISIANGAAWTFYPITFSLPFQLSKIKPREIATAIGFMETTVWIGAFIGPIMTGAIEEITGDLRGALTLASLSSLGMSISAVLLPKKWDKVNIEDQETMEYLQTN